MALREFVRLKGRARNPTRFLVSVCALADEDWEGRLGIHPNSVGRIRCSVLLQLLGMHS